MLHIAESTARVAAGFVCGGVLAIIVGATMGLSRRLDALLDPGFQALRAIPSLAWVPVLLLWMGIDEAPKITLVASGALFPVHLSVVSGIRNVDRKLVELGAVYRLPRWRLFTRILLPAAMPAIFTGLRTGLALSWMFVVAAELIAATRGLGYLLSDGRETGRPDMAQRVAIARGLYTQPQLLLLDEPFSAVDAMTRMRLQDLLLTIAEAHKMAALVVTHDLDEALYLADRIMLLEPTYGETGKKASSSVFDVRPCRRARRRAETANSPLRSILLDRLDSSRAVAQR